MKPFLCALDTTSFYYDIKGCNLNGINSENSENRIKRILPQSLSSVATDFWYPFELQGSKNQATLDSISLFLLLFRFRKYL